MPHAIIPFLFFSSLMLFGVLTVLQATLPTIRSLCASSTLKNRPHEDRLPAPREARS